jgi:hypothetical protein
MSSRYTNYLILKGSCISIGTCVIHYDQGQYDNLDKSCPESYLGHPLVEGEYDVAANPYDWDHFIFGAGCRTYSGS